LPLTRTRAERLAHVQQTNRQYHRPALREQPVDQAKRAGLALRFPAPAVQKRVAGDLALIADDTPRLHDVEWTNVQTAKPHEAQLQNRRAPSLASARLCVWCDATRAMPAPASRGAGSCVRWPPGHMGTGIGRHTRRPSGAQGGQASLTWAVSNAAVLVLRTKPPGPQDLARFERTHGQGQALTVLAHQLARAVDDRRTRDTGCDRPKVLTGSGSGAGEPHAARDAPGLSGPQVRC
jgi:hypothetical protein